MINLPNTSANDMQETGKVTKLENGFAIVRIDRKAECEKCGVCGMKKDMRFVELSAENTLGAVEGDTVEVETGNGSRLLSVILAFLVPLLLIAAIIAIGYVFIKKDLIILALCLITLILWYTILAVIDKKIAKIRGFCPIITKIKGGDTNE